MRQSSDREADGPGCVNTGAKKWKLMWANTGVKLKTMLQFRVLQKCGFQGCDDVFLTGTVQTETELDASDKNYLEIH